MQATAYAQQGLDATSERHITSRTAVVLQLMQSSHLRPAVVTGALVQLIGALLRAAWGPAESQGFTEAQAHVDSQLQSLLEALMHGNVLLQQGHSIVSYLMPDMCKVRASRLLRSHAALYLCRCAADSIAILLPATESCAYTCHAALPRKCRQCARQMPSASLHTSASMFSAAAQVIEAQLHTGPEGGPSDVAANMARLLCETVIHLVSNPSTYAVTPEERQHAQGSDLTAALDEALHDTIIPFLPQLACEGDMLPLYAQKILAATLARCSSYIIARLPWMEWNRCPSTQACKRYRDESVQPSSSAA